MLSHARSACRFREDKEGIEHSAAILRAAVAELAAYLALPVQRIVLGGYIQSTDTHIFVCGY